MLDLTKLNCTPHSGLLIPEYSSAARFVLRDSCGKIRAARFMRRDSFGEIRAARFLQRHSCGGHSCGGQ